MKNKTLRRDSDWSKAVREKFKNKCPHCNLETGSSHHIIPKDNKLTRWIIENGIYCCNKLHRAFEEKYRGESLKRKVDFYTDKGRYRKLELISRGISRPVSFNFEVIE